MPTHANQQFTATACPSSGDSSERSKTSTFACETVVNEGFLRHWSRRSTHTRVERRPECAEDQEAEQGQD